MKCSSESDDHKRCNRCQNKECNRGKSSFRKLRAKEIKAKKIKAKEIEAKNIRAEKIEANDMVAKNIRAEKIETDDMVAKNIRVEKIEADDMVAKNIRAEKIEADDMVVENGNIVNLVSSNAKFSQLTIDSAPITLYVGPDKEFKTPQEAVDSLSGRLIVGPVNIMVDSGIYPSLSIHQTWYSFTNEPLVNIIGDQRSITSGAPWIQSPPFSYKVQLTIHYEYLEDEDKTKIYGTVSDRRFRREVNVKQNGLIPGDKVVLYNNDHTVQIDNKGDRFLSKTVIDVENGEVDGTPIEYFTVSGNILQETNNGLLSYNSTVTFLPNVTLRTTEGGCIYINKSSCTITGICCDEPDEYNPDGYYYGVLIDSSIIHLSNIVVKSTTDVDKGFKLQYGFLGQSSTIGSKQGETRFVIVLGCGHKIPAAPGFTNFSPIKIDGSRVSITELSSIGSMCPTTETAAIFCNNLSAPEGSPVGSVLCNVIYPTRNPGENLTGFVFQHSQNNIPSSYVSNVSKGSVYNDIMVPEYASQYNYAYDVDDTVTEFNNVRIGLVQLGAENINNGLILNGNSEISIGEFTRIKSYLLGFAARDNSVINVQSLPTLVDPLPNSVDYCVSENGEINFGNIPNPPPINQCQ